MLLSEIHQLADSRNHEWRNDGRDDPQFHLRETELSGLDGDPDVARCHQSCAAAQRSAMNPRNYRLGTLCDREVHSSQRACILDVFVARVLRHPLHPIQIGAGAERFSVSGKDNDTDVVTCSKFGEGLRDQGNQFVVECIVNFRPIDGDSCDRFLDVDFQHRFTF